MVYVNDGIEEVQSVAIRNSGGSTPINLIYAGSDNTFTGLETEFENEITYTSLIWSKEGINSKYRTILTSLDAVGSYIGTIGIATGSSIVNSTLHTIAPSFIGNKDNTFNVQIEGEIIMRRPNA